MDESGDPYSWQNQKCYVIGGVAIHEGQIQGISSQMDALQTQYFPGIQIQIAFHASEIRRGKGHFQGMLPSRRNQLLQAVYGLIGNASFPNLVVFGTVMDINAVQNPVQARRDTFEDVCEKFNIFLVHQYQRGHPSKGLLIIDENREAEYRELVNDFKKQGTAHGYLGNIVDIPYFARCYQTRMLQLADFVANAVFEYYQRNDNTNLNTIVPRIYGNTWGKLSQGLGHITKAPNCACVACV
jgi:hypothetical protein